MPSLTLISDLHGRLPKLTPADVCVIAGDICPAYDHSLDFQAYWLRTEFADWMVEQPVKRFIATWGNHDWIGQLAPERVPPLPWKMLVDEAYEWEGLTYWGSPWQRRFCDWAFNLDEPELEAKYNAMPEGVDVMISHGPMYGHGDMTIGGREYLGSPSLYNRLAQPECTVSLLVCGHIHTGRGVYRGPRGMLAANASLLDEQYREVYKPILVNYEGKTLTDFDASR
jgi:hypothetical protein